MIKNLDTALEKEKPALTRYIRAVVKNESIADDLTQETMLLAFRGSLGLKDSASFVPWLFRIAINVCRDYFRKQKGTREQLLSNWISIEPQDLRDENAPQLDKVMECSEMSECVQRFFADLPDSYRTVIIMHDLEGMTNPEIADMLEISLDTAKIRLHRARKRLRTILKDACEFHIDERGILVCEPK